MHKHCTWWLEARVRSIENIDNINETTRTPSGFPEKRTETKHQIQDNQLVPNYLKFTVQIEIRSIKIYARDDEKKKHCVKRNENKTKQKWN